MPMALADQLVIGGGGGGAAAASDSRVLEPSKHPQECCSLCIMMRVLRSSEVIVILMWDILRSLIMTFQHISIIIDDDERNWPQHPLTIEQQFGKAYPEGENEEMYPAILLQRSKYPKIGREPNTGASKDIISKLPDCVLNSILSLLPTKEAIRTSLLSKWWQYLWTSLSHIDLNDGSECNVTLLNFVERFLLLHDASDIKSFRLCFSCPVNPSRVHSWVSAVVKHKVEEIDLTLPIAVSLPCCLFTCESLAVLKISMPGVLKVPLLKSSLVKPHLVTWC